MAKYYEFEVTQKIVVEAENKEYAQEAAEEAINELDWQAYDVVNNGEIKALSGLPAGWDGNCIPYGWASGSIRLKDLLPEK